MVFLVISISLGKKVHELLIIFSYFFERLVLFFIDTALNQGELDRKRKENIKSICQICIKK